MSVPRTKRHFQLIFIKPSHYDDEGYVVQRTRSSIPSSSLACIYALALDAAERKILGPNVTIDITAVDETSTRFRAKEIVAQFERHGGFGMVGLVDVTSGQFSRALDIARPLRAAGVPVVFGGFVVGDEMPSDLQTDLRQAIDMGCSLFSGDANNGRIDAMLRDAANGALQSVYNHLDSLPALEAAPSPFLPPEALKRMIDHYASFDADRGCPFQCSFCTIIDIQGRKTRRYSADDVERSIRAHYQEGVPWFFITADSFARNKDWEQILDRIILLRQRDEIALKIAVQVDVLSHEVPNFVAKAARAGVRKVFVELENSNPPCSHAARKRQNKSVEHRSMMLAWKNAGVVVYSGNILGVPNDTPEAREDKKELPIDVPGFFCYAAASSRIRRALPIRMTGPRSDDR